MSNLQRFGVIQLVFCESIPKAALFPKPRTRKDTLSSAIIAIVELLRA
jgi:hypothetical protein